MHSMLPSLSAPEQIGEALQASHHTLEALFESVPAAIVVSDESGRIVRVNALVETLFGYSREELLGQPVEKLVPERFRLLYVEHRQQYLQDPQRSAMGAGLELYGKHKAGNEFPIDAILSSVETQQGKRILSLIQDFTARDPAVGFRLHLAALVDSSGEAIIGRTLDGIICSWNKSAERIFGYSAESAVGKPLDMLYPPGSEDEEADVSLRLMRGETINAYDAVRRRADGQNVAVSVSISPIFDPLGTLVGASKVAREITERKQLEAEIELRREQAMVSARLSELGMMAGSIAHEINNPLAVIHASASDLLEMAESGAVPIKELEIASSRIKRTADRISKIVKSLRQIARKGNNDPFQRASAAEIVEQVLDLSRERFRVHSVSLDTTVIDPDLFVLCREVQIAQVLLNLLLNAFDAAVEAPDKKWVQVEVTSHPDTVMFAVIDSGPGIPADLKSRIMEPFFTTKPVGKGTGLGLSLSKALVEEHGGQLLLSERENHTCFSLFSPVSRSQKMQLRDATILVVDDEPDLRDILAGWFRRSGAHVLTANDGAEALQVIRETHVDVVISDVRMPVMDGISLLKTIKAENRYKSSIMFLSGFTDIEAREAYDLGVEAVMSKPVDRKALFAVVTRVLAERSELWCLPPASKPETMIDAVFESLDTALRQKLLAFGRGGFCIHSAGKFNEGPVDLQLHFKKDNRNVKGHGLIRWTALPEPQVGVEITYVDDDNRAWILGLTEPNKSLSFIPRTTAAEAVPTLDAGARNIQTAAPPRAIA